MSARFNRNESVLHVVVGQGDILQLRGGTPFCECLSVEQFETEAQGRTWI